MEIGLHAAPAVAKDIRCGHVVEVKMEGGKAACRFTEGGSILISKFLAAHIVPGDEIDFPQPTDSPSVGVEICVQKKQSAGPSRDLYQGRVNYVARPKPDKRGQFYVRAELSTCRLGISSIHLPCDVVRDYFYVSARGEPWGHQTNLYDVLQITPTASPAELRLAFRLRQLELSAEGASKHDRGTLERAFNILAQPELRSCCDSLLKDSSAPALFPYGGFGSILVAGNRSRDGLTFFATEILSFRPEWRDRRFRAPLRNFDFHDDRAIYRDARRKLDVSLDQSAMPIIWDGTWNQWKHLLGAKVEVQGTFITTGDYRNRGGVWQLVKWETALPSRIEVKVPANIAEQIEMARTRYHRFGKFSDALANIRARIECEPVEREELRNICWDLGLPGDFDIAQINWQPNYEIFFLREISKRAQRLYLFQSEYILELERCVVIETPQPGHATYLFSKCRTMEEFLAIYMTCTKGQIRRNSSNSAEKLGFLGRIAHGTNPRTWLKELRSRLGESMNSESDDQ